MTLYEGLAAEKLAVVLDIGTRYTKFGFIGEFSPRCIIPTEIYCSRSEKVRKIFDYENEQDLYALLVAFIHKLYFRHVLVRPKDRNVVVVESLLCPTQFRDTLASVLYRHYEHHQDCKIKSLFKMSYWKIIALIFWPLPCLCFEVGYSASMVNFPFVCGIYYKKGHFHYDRPFCTGTLIMDSFVLTTAGCMDRKSPEPPNQRYAELAQDLNVWVGSSFDYVLVDSYPEAQMVDVDHVHLPEQEDLKALWPGATPKYNYYKVGNFTYFHIDFALLQTKKKIVYNSYVHAIPFDIHNYTESVNLWKITINRTEELNVPVPDCFIAGWGSHGKGPEAGRLYRLRYVKVHYTEMIHCTIAYCGDCSLCRLRDFNENEFVCYSMYLGGDTCLEDEGAPLFCPWLGYKNNDDVGWGAMLGHMTGKMGDCREAVLPSMFSLIWLAYPFMTRITKLYWPLPPHEWIVPMEEGGDDYELELQ